MMKRNEQAATYEDFELNEVATPRNRNVASSTII